MEGVDEEARAEFAENDTGGGRDSNGRVGDDDRMLLEGGGKRLASGGLNAC